MTEPAPAYQYILRDALDLPVTDQLRLIRELTDRLDTREAVAALSLTSKDEELRDLAGLGLPRSKAQSPKPTRRARRRIDWTPVLFILLLVMIAFSWDSVIWPVIAWIFTIGGPK